MKRYILCSILLFFVSTISYACENFSITIKCDRETIYKYWLWKELSGQYSDSQFKRFLNHKIAYALRTYFHKPKEIHFPQAPENFTKSFVSLDRIMLKQALKNSIKLEEEKNGGILDPYWSTARLVDTRKQWEQLQFTARDLSKEDSNSKIHGLPWDNID